MTLGKPEIVALPVSALAAERGSLAASAIEGAIAAGLAGAQTATDAGPYTLPRYVRWLAGNHLFAGRTPGLFRRGAERLEAAGRPALASFARRKAAEESGHAALACRDLEALGLPGAKTVRLIAPPSASEFGDRFRDHVESSDPIALFGFSYCLERMAVERDEAFIRRVRSVCPPGLRAFRFLKVHSTIGSDCSHVHEQLALFETLTAPELATVAQAAFETATLLARQPAMDAVLSDEEVERRLREAGIRFPVAAAAPRAVDGVANA